MYRPKTGRTFFLLAALLAALGVSAHAQGAGVGDKAVGGGGPGTPAHEVDYSRPFTTREVTKKAVLTERPEPGYTEEARENKVEGVVKLRAVLASTGEVKSISIIKGLPDGLTERALAAARRIRFTPAQKDGRDVSQWVTVEYNFNIYYDEDDPEVTRKAVINEKPEAEYTEAARRNGTEGSVVLQLTLTSRGTVSVDHVVRGLPDGLTEKAVEAARRIKFTPAEMDGRPVSVVRNVEYVFALK